MTQYLVFENPSSAPGAFKQKQVIVNVDHIKYIEPVDTLTFKLQLNNGGNIIIGAAVAKSSEVIEKIRSLITSSARISSGKILTIKPDFIGQWTIDGITYNPPSSVGVTADGTPAAGWNTRWTSDTSIGGQWVLDSGPTGGFPGNPIIKGYRSTIQWPTERGFFSKGAVWMTGYPIGDMDPWLAKDPDDCRDFLALELCGAGSGADVPFDFATVANRFADNVVIASKFIQQGLTDTATYNRENVIIGAGTTGNAIKGNNCQENVWIGYDMFDDNSGGDGLDRNLSSTVIIGAYAFGKGIEGNGNVQYGVYIGREIGRENTVDISSIGNVHIGWRASGGHVYGGNNVCIGMNSSNDLDGTSQVNNTMIGASAGLEHTSGDNNTFIGYLSGPANNAASGGSNNTCLGNGAQISGTAVDNEIVLGNASVSVLRCAQGSISALSDERDKKDIVELDEGLQTIMSLKPKKFVWDPREIEVKTQIITEDEDKVKEEERVVEFVKPANAGVKDIGFIAQDLQEVDNDFLRLVYDANPDKLEASYGRLVPVLVKAIQELKNELDKKQDK